MHRLFLAVLLAACNTPEAVTEAAPEAADAVAEASAEAGEADAKTQTLDKPGQWGGEFTLTEAEPLQALIDDPDSHVDKEVRVVGEVTNVCQKAGCWMVLRAEGGESVRVTMKDHGFAVAKDLAGSECHVEGKVVKHAVDPKTVAHYESEGGTEHVPEKGKSEVYEIVATTVAIKG